jgi:hypothetical protein
LQNLRPIHIHLKISKIPNPRRYDYWVIDEKKLEVINPQQPINRTKGMTIGLLMRRSWKYID